MSQDSYRILQSQIHNELDEALTSLKQEFTPGKNKMKSSSQNSSRGSSQDQEEVEDVRDYKPINLFMQVKKLKRRNHELEAQFEALRLEALQNKEAFEAEKVKLLREKDELEKTLAMFHKEVEKAQSLEVTVAKMRSEKAEMDQTLSTLLGEATAAELAALAPSHQKQAAEKAMECVVCLSVNPGRVLQCSQGHLICQTCHSNLLSRGVKGKTVECPVCRVPYPPEPIRNLLAEQLAQTLSLL